ncbi:MFS transporter [Streptomyces sp. J2-1]|uniref:MFS transporter n=1 Tax=Streptomyces corallincola TaxID=2851888 RepID=UPI001C38D373|nr:MFS transporter [Streptomyces corallincola]MBV2357747.1 MFS transporter [Streptomyces corallincola]
MSYRDIATRRTSAWACVSVAARMPVAMAPLALVLLARERPGGYPLGAALAALFVLGEIVGAPLLGTRLHPDRARPRMSAQLAAGAVGFAGLGTFPGAHPAVLGAFAFLAGGAPAAVTGGLRVLLTSLVPEHAAPQALSLESMTTSAIWALAPVTVAWLALGVAPGAPLLLAAALMALGALGLRLLPDGRPLGGRSAAAGDTRALLRVWPVYVTGAASLSLLALAELVLPALLEQRGIGVGWSGPLLLGMALAAGLGAFLYGLRSWPGRFATRGAVLLCVMSAAVALAALTPAPAVLAAALGVAGLLQSGAMLTRNLALRAALPPEAQAAGYSVMYAAVGVGYALTGSVAGLLMRVAAPSTAVLAGVALTLLMTGIGWWGEIRRDRTSGTGAPVPSAAPARQARP